MPPREITDIPGTAYIAPTGEGSGFHPVACPSYEEVCADKTAYARATKIQYDEHDPIRGCAVLQPCQGRVLVVNPPARPLSREALDALYDLPYVREVHPMYREEVPAIEEVRFSITTTGAASAAATSAHWPFIRGAWSPPAPSSPWCGRRSCYAGPEVQGLYPRCGRPYRGFPFPCL